MDLAARHWYVCSFAYARAIGSSFFFFFFFFSSSSCGRAERNPVRLSTLSRMALSITDLMSVVWLDLDEAHDLIMWLLCVVIRSTMRRWEWRRATGTISRSIFFLEKIKIAPINGHRRSLPSEHGAETQRRAAAAAAAAAADLPLLHGRCHGDGRHQQQHRRR